MEISSDITGSHSAEQALARLKEGNARFISARTNPGDCSPERRRSLYLAQTPYAAIVSCSDSRVVPEDIFCTGLGEIFVIRVAGNLAGDSEIASIEYATRHLGARLVVVIGHENCGAVAAAIGGHSEGHLHKLTDPIKEAIGDETDPHKAGVMNADSVARRIRAQLAFAPDEQIKVVSAYYKLSGEIEFHEV